MKSLQILAHPRSGHHAFIDWLCSHQKNWMLHVNDPKIEGRKLTPTGGGHAYNGSQRVGFAHAAYASPTCMVVNIERPDCRAFFVKDFDRLLFIRDFKTFMSSVAKLSEKMGDPSLPELSVPAWDWMADRCIKNKRFVFFDLWASSKEYRIQIAKVLGFETDGEPWRRVSPYGGTRESPGSSYDSLAYDGRADQMGVTLRDETHSPIYQKYATKDRLQKNEHVKWLANQPPYTLRLF